MRGVSTRTKNSIRLAETCTAGAFGLPCTWVHVLLPTQFLEILPDNKTRLNRPLLFQAILSRQSQTRHRCIKSCPTFAFFFWFFASPYSGRQDGIILCNYVCRHVSCYISMLGRQRLYFIGGQARIVFFRKTDRCFKYFVIIQTENHYILQEDMQVLFCRKAIRHYILRKACILLCSKACRYKKWIL